MEYFKWFPVSHLQTTSIRDCWLRAKELSFKNLSFIIMSLRFQGDERINGDEMFGMVGCVKSALLFKFSALLN